MLHRIAALLIGVLLDRLFGEPRRWHPLIGFGRLAAFIEHALRSVCSARPIALKLVGLLAWCIAVLPLVALAVSSTFLPWGFVADALLLYFSLGARSLSEHAHAVFSPLAQGDLSTARKAVAMMVSRNTHHLDEVGIAAATAESVLENGNDAIFGTLFWFCVAGGSGALAYRLANTLDASWGYRNERYLHFGWAAARIDDCLNYFPARLTALTYALLGRTRDSLHCWRTQARNCSSPNAGPVMAAGAGALGIQLGGPAYYDGEIEDRPLLGCGRAPCADDIQRANKIVISGMLCWLAAMTVMALIWNHFHA